MILVTGATGSNGTEIVKCLATRNVQVLAMVRNRDRASAIAVPNVEVVEGDFNRPKTLLSALAGVERAFFLTNSSEHAEALTNRFHRCGTTERCQTHYKAVAV